VYGGEVETLLDALFEYASMFTKEKDDLTELLALVSGKVELAEVAWDLVKNYQQKALMDVR